MSELQNFKNMQAEHDKENFPDAAWKIVKVRDERSSKFSR